MSTQSNQIEIAAGLPEIVIMPASELEEIIQNVRMILNTFRGSAPMDRGFGVPSEFIDMPVTVLRTKVAAEIITCVTKFEPRAKVRKVNFGLSDVADGVNVASVIVEPVPSKLRGGF